MLNGARILEIEIDLMVKVLVLYQVFFPMNHNTKEMNQVLNYPNATPIPIWTQAPRRLMKRTTNQSVPNGKSHPRYLN